MVSITSLDALREMVDYYLQYDQFAFDVETLAQPGWDEDKRGDPFRNWVVWLSFATYGRTDVLPLGHPNGDFIRWDFPLTAAGEARVAAGKAPLKSSYSTDLRKATGVFTQPPIQLQWGSAVREILEPLFFSDLTKIGHNIKFDLKSIAKHFGGRLPSGPYVDTKVAAFILDSRNKGYLDLKSCCLREVEYNMVKGVGSNIAKHTFYDVERYSFLDARYTWLLWKEYERQIESEGLSGLWSLESDVLDVVVNMEMTGAPVAVGRLKELDEYLRGRIEDTTANLYRMAGRPFNINANVELSTVMFTPKKEGGIGIRPKVLTDGGAKKKAAGEELSYRDYSIAEKALKSYVGHPFVDAVLEYGELKKLHGGFVVPYLGGEIIKTVNGRSKTEIRESLLIDGRLHATFSQDGAETGRFSSKDPNLQQVPSRSEDGKRIRSLFSTEEIEGDFVIVQADYSQIEPRVLADFSEEPSLLKVYLEGGDIYTTLAEPFGLERAAGKLLFLSVAYGTGPDTLANAVGMPLKDAKKIIYEDFPKAFPRIDAAKKAVVRSVKRNKPAHVRTMLGRRRYLPEIFSTDPYAKARAERQAFNCVDLETEALTRRGWVRGDELIAGEEVLTKNADTGALEWQPVRDIKIYSGEVPLVSIESTSFSALTTPNHRWLVFNKSTRTDVCKTTAELSRYGDHRIHRTGKYSGGEAVLSDDYIRLAGWFLTDGSIIRANNGVYVCQSQRAKPERVAEIDALLGRLGVESSRRVSSRTQCVYWQFHDDFASALRTHFPERILTDDFLSMITGDQAALLVKTMLAGDGTRDYVFTCRGSAQADAFQALCMLAGYATTARWRDMSAYAPVSTWLTNTPKMTGVWLVTVLQRDTVQVHRHQVKEYVSPEATVWCPVVDNTYFVARRSGTVYITGNTYVQGTAGDINKIGLVRCHQMVSPLGGKTIATVHDEVLVLAERNNADQVAVAVREALEGASLLKTVPLVAETKIVTNWAQAKD